jgi:hypothetical protein
MNARLLAIAGMLGLLVAARAAAQMPAPPPPDPALQSAIDAEIVFNASWRAYQAAILKLNQDRGQTISDLSDRLKWWNECASRPGCLEWVKPRSPDAKAQ